MQDEQAKAVEMLKQYQELEKIKDNLESVNCEMEMKI